jgi:hypothetical protein
MKVLNSNLEKILQKYFFSTLIFYEFSRHIEITKISENNQILLINEFGRILIDNENNKDKFLKVLENYKKILKQIITIY